MALSNRRPVAMYNFIFDENEMGNYQYRTKLKKIWALLRWVSRKLNLSELTWLERTQIVLSTTAKRNRQLFCNFNFIQKIWPVFN